ncbi:tetratricopeptide repeat protein [Kordia jejudonensis]|uniref:tetratricopeptide repeat protein n=1 Tax=Kordia jejudonensis TaxID=1348245 RepID=UPI0006295826|nr:tetratricopeptide repeat protein [Kordia jejudonensis]
MASRLTEELLAEMHRYLNDDLNELERRRFEQKIAQNSELKRELTLEKELREALNAQSDYDIFQNNPNNEELATLKSKLRSDEYQQLSNTIKAVGDSYLEEEANKKPRKNYLKYVMVAAVLIFCCSIYFLQVNPSLNSYYEANVNWNELPSFVEKGQQEDLFSQGELAFRASNYEEAVAKFSQIETSNELYVFSLQYLGASYDQLDRNEEAIAIFQQLTTSGNSAEHSKGYWYETLLHLKMNNKEKAINTLENLIKDPKNFNYEKAKNLLEKLR